MCPCSIFNVYDSPGTDGVARSRVVSAVVPTAASMGTLYRRCRRDRGGKLRLFFSACRDVGIVRSFRRGSNLGFSLIVYSRTRQAANMALTKRSSDGFIQIRSSRCVRTGGHLCVATAPQVCTSTDGRGTGSGDTLLYSVSSRDVCNPRFCHLDFSSTMSRKLLSSCGMIILTISRRFIDHSLRGRLASDGGRLALSSTIGVINYVGNLTGGARFPKRRGCFSGSPRPVHHTITFARAVRRDGGFITVFRRVRTLCGVGAGSNQGRAIRLGRISNDFGTLRHGGQVR